MLNQNFVWHDFMRRIGKNRIERKYKNCRVERISRTSFFSKSDNTISIGAADRCKQALTLTDWINPSKSNRSIVKRY